MLRRLVAVALTTAVALAVPGPAAAYAPALVGWSELLPPLAHTYTPTSSDDCVAGLVACVDATVRTMSGQYAKLANYGMSMRPRPRWLYSISQPLPIPHTLRGVSPAR